MKKQRVTLYLDSRTWQLFRVLCLREKVSASALVERFMQAELGGTNIPEQFGTWEDGTPPDQKKEEQG
jgi:hypothetical protein